jgi:alcohol dehydrogenase
MDGRVPPPFEFRVPTGVVFGPGCLEKLGEIAAGLGFTRSLLVADPGVRAAGHVERAMATLDRAGIVAVPFHEFGSNPDGRMVEAGRRAAAEAGVDSLVALGGGSSLDCAKGINFLHGGGGRMRDYRGFGKAKGPMLPSIGIPTTAGTGSEAQSYAIIADEETHAKMACGDPGAAFRVALLDPELTLTAPRPVKAAAGYDALSHAVESFVTTRRTPASELFALEAWRLLEASYPRVLEVPGAATLDAHGAMLLGAHWAGLAIELSMLGATHACANPLTARYGTVHADAIAVMLPHVVRWNEPAAGDRYGTLLRTAGLADGPTPGAQLAGRLEALARLGGLPATLRDLAATRADLPALAADAATQWTGTFNPRPFDAAGALSLYERAY